jgi:hypothetical protein
MMTLRKHTLGTITRFSLKCAIVALYGLALWSNPAQSQPMQPCYHTRAAIDTFLEALIEADSVYHIVHVDTIGYSRGDMLSEIYPIYAVKISDNPDVFESEPTALFVGQVHAEEVLGVEMVLEYMWRLVTHYASYSELIESTQLYFVPTMNPDGLEVLSRGLDIHWRKNGYYPPELNGDTCNIYPGYGGDSCGVDLNRNFGLNWIYGDTLWEWRAATPEPFDYYRGPAAFSEPESQAIRDFAMQIKPAVSVVFHSSNSGTFSQKGYAPWQWGDDPGPYKFAPDNAAIGTVNSSYCSKFQGTPFLATFSRSRNGNIHEWFYWKLGTIQILTELGPVRVTQPLCDTLAIVLNAYLPALDWLAKRPANIGMDGPTPLNITTRDSVTGLPISAEWRLADTWNAYLDPWYTNEETGMATTLLPTPGLDTITVRKFGYRTKSMTTVINPNTFPRNLTINLAPLPQYAVSFFTENESGTPIAGHILAENEFQTWIDLPSGAFSRNLPEGQYRVMAVPNDTTRMVLWRNVHIGSDATIGFRLEPATTLWSENWETTGLANWTSGGNANPWRLEADTTAMDFGQTLCFSPVGYREQYANNLDIWLATANSIQLNTGNSAYLEFYRRGRLEKPTDSLLVEVSTDGSTWEFAAGFSDIELPWTRTLVDLTPWVSHSVFLRLHFKSDNAIGDLGLNLDGFRIRGGNDSASPEPPANVAYSYRITGAYPNPFNPATTITYEAARPGRIRLSIYNVLGEEVRQFNVNPSAAGPQKLIWDGTTNGGTAASGLYFVQMNAPDVQSVHKLLLLR